jgi:phosphonate transport system permease protein
LSQALPLLPAAQLAPLLAAYARAGRAAFWRSLLVATCLVAGSLASGWMAEVDLGKLASHIGGFFSYFDRLTRLEGGGGRVWTDPGEWFWGLRPWLVQLGDTILMAYAGTLFGALGGFCLAVLGAANLVKSLPLRWGAKRLAEFCRTVPDLVFALLFVIAFGLGPLPGVMALAIHSLGALGKQNSELVENIDMKPVEGAIAAGAGWVAMVRFAVLPQILPGFLSYSLLRFEINVRGAAVLGFVGAGGIGQDLIEAVRKFYYNDVAALLVLIILTVVIIDTLTGLLRRRLLEAR